MVWFAEIGTYSLVLSGKSYSASSNVAQIHIRDTNNRFRGYLLFYPDDVDLPNNTESVINGVEWCRIYMHRSEFHSAVDMLRNEKPVYVHFTNPTAAFIRTGPEPVGEEENPQP